MRASRRLLQGVDLNVCLQGLVNQRWLFEPVGSSVDTKGDINSWKAAHKTFRRGSYFIKNLKTNMQILPTGPNHFPAMRAGPRTDDLALVRWCDACMFRPHSC